MHRSEAEWAGWAREHRAAFQTVPLVEVVRGDRRQVGFSITLYVAAPLDAAPGARVERVAALWDELTRLAEDVAPPEQRAAKVQVEQAPRVVLRPENEFSPEVGLTFHVFPRGGGGMEAVTEADRERMAQVERRLAAFGVKAGRA